MRRFLILFLTAFISTVFLSGMGSSANAARDVHGELQNIKKQRAMVKKAQQELTRELGSVGKSLKKMDVSLLEARNAYRSIRKEIVNVDQHLHDLGKEKASIKSNMTLLYQQMVKEATVAYKHSGIQSVWVDVLSDTSITEIPHRQYLLKSAVLSQEKDRASWRKTMHKLSAVEKEEQTNKEKLLTLQQQRKDAERKLVRKIGLKKAAAKKLRSNLEQKKAQEKRLARQEKALQHLLDGLGDTLLASDKKTKVSSIRKKKGKLPWPLKGRVLVAYGQTTSTGTKLAGVHLSPKKRSESGKLVHALGQGQVRYADWFGGYGLMMIVDYGQGIMAVYAHNDALHKQLGDWVEENEVLAEAGSTGWIEDVRLYFEIRDQGKPVNPSRWCKK